MSVTVNKTIRQRTFLKYKVLIERVDMCPSVRKEWQKLDEDGNYGYAPEYDAVEYDSTEALKMEVREEIDLRQVVKALLWKESEESCPTK